MNQEAKMMLALRQVERHLERRAPVDGAIYCAAELFGVEEAELRAVWKRKQEAVNAARLALEAERAEKQTASEPESEQQQRRIFLLDEAG